MRTRTEARPAQFRPAWVAAACVYVVALAYLAMDVRQRAGIRAKRLSDFSAFATLIQQVPVPSRASATPSEALLVRLQRSVDQLGLKDRAPKLSAGASSPGQPSSVSLSVEGVPFDRIAELLDLISAEPDVAVPIFQLERSGASDERFDLTATFVEFRPSGS